MSSENRAVGGRERAEGTWPPPGQSPGPRLSTQEPEKEIKCLFEDEAKNPSLGTLIRVTLGELYSLPVSQFPGP